MYTILHDTGDRFEAQGNVFRDAVHADVVRVDGDLICRRLAAGTVEVINGSLLCPSISAVSLHADILGVFGTVAVTHPAWTFKWVRPLLTLPIEAALAPSDTICNGLAVIAALDLPELQPHANQLAACTTCGDFWLAFRHFHSAAQALYAEGRGTPLQRQFMECLARHGLPLGLWRF